MSSYTVSGGPLVLIGASHLNKIKQLTECQSHFCLDFQGASAGAAISALVIKDAQVFSPTHMRAHYANSNGARMAHHNFGKWKEAVPSADCVCILTSTQSTAQKCADLTSPGISGSSSGQSGPVVAIRGGGWRVQSIHEEDGDPVEIVLTRGGFVRAAPEPAERVIRSPKEAVEAVVELSMRSLRSTPVGGNEEAPEPTEPEGSVSTEEDPKNSGTTRKVAAQKRRSRPKKGKR
jgi:hypothetical protein